VLRRILGNELIAWEAIQASVLCRVIETTDFLEVFVVEKISGATVMILKGHAGPRDVKVTASGEWGLRVGINDSMIVLARGKLHFSISYSRIKLL
jgi:hypothetical protein